MEETAQGTHEQPNKDETDYMKHLSDRFPELTCANRRRPEAHACLPIIANLSDGRRHS
jgi:hypothetical protein